MFSQFRNLFFARGDTKGLNTVGLTGDLDDVGLLMDVEETFGIKLTEVEAQNARTMGDLERLVVKRLKRSGIDPAWALLQRIVRDHSGSKDGINRETTFFAKYAKPREAESG